ncbi:MAG: hypothetical protein QM728_04545 [Gordonia sp. (in: high G+C Gram-positive bacteria)]|uniref:hypothetical protein n=1 Tax=Gordonia sp. (in: high G+C Gram-positive bacteria) TaxID=84139 RepID=UPI0039E48CD9
MRRAAVFVVAAAAAVSVAGCTVTGTPHADPGATYTPPTTPSRPFKLPGLDNAPVVPPPANARTMNCREYMLADDSTQQAVVRVFGAVKRTSMAATLLQMRCLLNQTSTVAVEYPKIPPAFQE